MIIERLLWSAAAVALIVWGYCMIRDEGRLIEGYAVSLSGSFIFFSLDALILPCCRMIEHQFVHSATL